MTIGTKEIHALNQKPFGLQRLDLLLGTDGRQQNREELPALVGGIDDLPALSQEGQLLAAKRVRIGLAPRLHSGQHLRLTRRRTQMPLRNVEVESLLLAGVGRQDRHVGELRVPLGIRHLGGFPVRLHRHPLRGFLVEMREQVPDLAGPVRVFGPRRHRIERRRPGRRVSGVCGHRQVAYRPCGTLRHTDVVDVNVQAAPLDDVRGVDVLAVPEQKGGVIRPHPGRAEILEGLRVVGGRRRGGGRLGRRRHRRHAGGDEVQVLAAGLDVVVRVGLFTGAREADVVGHRVRGANRVFAPGIDGGGVRPFGLGLGRPSRWPSPQGRRPPCCRRT